MNNKSEPGMTIIVKTVTRLTLGFILLYGIYIALNGRVAPGGGFAGGVIIALSLVHIMLAFGKEVALKRLHSHVLRIIIGIAAPLFLFMVMTDYTKAKELAIPLCEMIIVGAGIFAIFVALVLLTRVDRDSE